MTVRMIRVCATIIPAMFGMAYQLEAGEVSGVVQSAKGESAGKGSGYVFVDGRYLDAPYTVTAREGWILVNGTNVRKYCDWPPRLDSPEKPQIPADVLKNAKSFDDLKLKDGSGDSWSACMLRWIYKSATNDAQPDVEAKMFFKSLPFVKDVVVDGFWWDIELRDGSVKRFGMESMPPGFETQEDIEKTLKKSAAGLQSSLDMGTAVLFFSSGKRLVFGRAKMAEDLALMCEVLTSDRSNEEKLDVLERMGIVPTHARKEGSALVVNFRVSEGLTRRIKELKDATGIKPRGIESVPVVGPAVAEEQRMQRLKLRIEAEQKAKETQGKSPKQGEPMGVGSQN